MLDGPLALGAEDRALVAQHVTDTGVKMLNLMHDWLGAPRCHESRRAAACGGYSLVVGDLGDALS